MEKRPGIFRALLWTFFSFSLFASLSAEVISEYQVKAAFLYNFVRFVQWPASDTTAAPTDTDPIVIGVAGRSALVDTFKSTFNDQSLGGHPLIVKSYEREWSRFWNVVFIPASDEDETPHILANLRGTKTLTVGESQHFLSQGGMINFYSENNRIRFAVNMAAVQKAGLKIDSQMLQYALIIGKN